jgi:hypothetical protein
MVAPWVILCGALLSTQVGALRYDQKYVGYNLNENKTATSPFDYAGKWEDVCAIPSSLAFNCGLACGKTDLISSNSTNSSRLPKLGGFLSIHSSWTSL